MRQPHELMSDDYCGPSHLISLEQIPNEAGYRFIGVDKNGGEHQCVVRKADSGRAYSYHMDSDTTTFENLCGWLPATNIVATP